MGSVSLLIMQGLYGLSVAAIAGAIAAILFVPETGYAEAFLLPAIALVFSANLIGGFRLLCRLIATTKALDRLRSHQNH